MRIQLVTLLCLFSLNLFASDDKAMKELFDKYDLVMKRHKVELVDEVFSKKFLKDNGGKEEFIAKVQELPKEKRQRLKKLLQSWKKSKVGRIFFAKVKDEDNKKAGPESQFVIIEEDGKLKIDGTISDDH